MLSLTRSNSRLPAISGTMISGATGLPVSRPACAAASKMARACISAISGYAIASRQPRKPSIGLNSCSSRARSANRCGSAPMACATSAISFSLCGRNSCSGGSRSRIVTGKPPMILNSARKSLRCIGRSLASAARRAASSSARIISRMARMRSSSKNICSVRHRPMPSAPNLIAARASAGVSALARTFNLRNSSAHFIMVANSPANTGSSIGTAPAKTCPVDPSMVSVSPFFSTMPPALNVCVR